jgi:lycopene cyclase domain-containing protein
MSTYAWVDLCSVLVPFLFSFHPRLRFVDRWYAAFPAMLGMMALFVPWDAWFTSLGVWGFSAEHVWPPRLWHLPLEEWLFFLFIPFCCLFCYHCFLVLRLGDPLKPWVRPISIVLIVLLLAIALWHWDHAYTLSAWTLCAVWIAYTAFVQKAGWLGRFYLMYTIILVPFLIVNGILTGTGLDTPVVWYNDQENLGLRILTIPVEDVFYGMLMLGLCVSIYETRLSNRGEHAPVHAR